MRLPMLAKGTWARFALTTVVLAVALTAIADTTHGKHAAPVVDWIVFSLVIAVLRLAVRYGYRAIKRPGTETP
jgi:hypothetical protein